MSAAAQVSDAFAPSTLDGVFRYRQSIITCAAVNADHLAGFEPSEILIGEILPPAGALRSDARRAMALAASLALAVTDLDGVSAHVVN